VTPGGCLPPLAIEDLDHVLSHTRDLWEEARGARFFITGGTGFFGIWLLETFARANDVLGLQMRAVVLTRNPASFSIKSPHLAGRADITLLEGDIRTFHPPPGAFDYVIHAATEASARLNDENPREMFDSILSGTSYVLSYAKAAGVRKFLFTSSGAVYGRQPPHITHIPETYLGAPDPLQPGSAYGLGKLAAEYLCVLEGRDANFEIKIARGFAFVGPHLPLDNHFAIGNFLRSVMNGISPRLSGDGTPRRSYLYASDMAIALWSILFQGPAGRAYNVGSKHDLSIAELAKTVCIALSRADLAPIHPYHALDNPSPSRYVPCVEKAVAELNICQHVSLEDAIRKTALYYSKPLLRSSGTFTAHA
jgi:nucleoside-diphosphate-sugar epimerase